MVSGGGLVIVAMRHMSRESLQCPIQNVQKEAFFRSFDGLVDFLLDEMSQWLVAVDVPVRPYWFQYQNPCGNYRRLCCVDFDHCFF
jgi:hypothetical protein